MIDIDIFNPQIEENEILKARYLLSKKLKDKKKSVIKNIVFFIIFCVCYIFFRDMHFSNDLYNLIYQSFHIIMLFITMCFSVNLSHLIYASEGLKSIQDASEDDCKEILNNNTESVVINYKNYVLESKRQFINIEVHELKEYLKK